MTSGSNFFLRESEGVAPYCEFIKTKIQFLEITNQEMKKVRKMGVIFWGHDLQASILYRRILL
jgi:hypothetical protein